MGIQCVHKPALGKIETFHKKDLNETQIAKSVSIETLDSAIRYLLFSKIETRKSIDPIFHEKETK